MTQDHIKKIEEILEDIIKHGFGEIQIDVSETKNSFRRKVIIKAGRSWVFFTEYRARLDDKNIL